MVVRPHLLPFGPHHTISLVSFFRSALDTVYITLQPWIIEQYCALFVFWYISLFLYLMTCNFDTFFFFWGGGLFTCWWIDIACSSFCLQTSGISWYDSKTKRKHRADSSGPVLWDSLKAVHQFPFFPNRLCCQALKSKRIKFWLHWSHPYLVVSHVATSMFLKDRWTFLAVLIENQSSWHIWKDVGLAHGLSVSLCNSPVRSKLQTVVDLYYFYCSSTLEHATFVTWICPFNVIYNSTKKSVLMSACYVWFACQASCWELNLLSIKWKTVALVASYICKPVALQW